MNLSCSRFASAACAVIVLATSSAGPLRSFQDQKPLAIPTNGARERIATNDNRTGAGTLTNGILTVRLDVRVGI